MPPNPVSRPMPAIKERPTLAIKSIWKPAHESRVRRVAALLSMLVVLVLYAWFLSYFYTGAHGGVDQSGYLMTARLTAGIESVDSPKISSKPVTVVHGLGSELSVTKPPANWVGGTKDYVAGVHPQPSNIQQKPQWDWLRNRISYIPESPFEFSSRMNIMTEPFGPASPENSTSGTRPVQLSNPAEYRIFSKYPFGYPLMAAVGRKLGEMFDRRQGLMIKQSVPIPVQAATGPEHISQPSIQSNKSQVMRFERAGRGIDGMYLVNPLCTVLACFFAYFLFRQAVSSFVALVGVIWLACNPLVLVYANDANSHASSLLCVCVGFWGLLSFSRTQQNWRAWIGGVTLGYACTIRYSEFLLVLPVVFVVAINFRLTWKRAAGSMYLLAAWAIPVAFLAFICWISFGSPFKTGYTYCNEDTGFGWKYLTGNWADRSFTGNWETLVQQINRVGLFMIWPLALVGLCGMVGSSWRLGGVIALWVIPSTFLYMLYYWAPGGDQTTGYLRFYVSVIPGFIFAGVWLLDRALAFLKGDKWAGLIMGTILGILLLIVLAFFADGGPVVIDGGLKKMIVGFVTQLPSAVGHLFTHSSLGALCASLIIVAIAGMWLFDRHLIGSRMGLALAGGALTALACAINLKTIMPSVERQFENQVALRMMVDNVRETLPPGNVIFSDDRLLQQLDGVGGWKLYNTSAFSVAMYNQVILKLAQRNSPERMDDPDPLQTERLQFYKELLTAPSPVRTIGLGPRTQYDLQQMEKTVIDRNLAMGHRVTFLMQTDPGDAPELGMGAGGFGIGGRIVIPEGYQVKMLRKWTVSAFPSRTVAGGVRSLFGMQGQVRSGRGGTDVVLEPKLGGSQAGTDRLFVGGDQTMDAVVDMPIQGPSYTLFEVLSQVTPQTSP